MQVGNYLRNANTNAQGQQLSRSPNADINALLSQMAMPGAPQAGGQMGAPTIPGMGDMGSAPTAQAASPDGKQKLINTMTAQAGGQLQQTGSPGMSALGGALQGGSLAASATGKSPISALGKAMGFGGQSGQQGAGAMPTAGGMDSMSFANELSGMPADPAGLSAGSAPAIPQVADAAAGMASAGDAGGQLGMDASQQLVDQLLSGGAEGLASEALPALAEGGVDATAEAALMEGGAAAAPETMGLSMIPGAVYGLGQLLNLW